VDKFFKNIHSLVFIVVLNTHEIMNYTYRFLENDDFQQFIGLHKTKNTFMNAPLPEAEKKVYIDRLTSLFYQPDYKVAGCFLGTELIAVGGCMYFKNKSAAYTHGQCFNLNYENFNHVFLFGEVFFNFCKLITNHAETLGIYQVYMSRELEEGITFYRYYDRLVKRNFKSLFTDLRYFYMLDRIYKKGETDISEVHSFFFKPEGVVKRDTLISFLTLKPESRIDLLRIDQQS
jgi:hypothetical protein